MFSQFSDFPSRQNVTDWAISWNDRPSSSAISCIQAFNVTFTRKEVDNFYLEMFLKCKKKKMKVVSNWLLCSSTDIFYHAIFVIFRIFAVQRKFQKKNPYLEQMEQLDLKCTKLCSFVKKQQNNNCKTILKDSTWICLRYRMVFFLEPFVISSYCLHRCSTYTRKICLFFGFKIALLTSIVSSVPNVFFQVFKIYSICL